MKTEPVVNYQFAGLNDGADVDIEEAEEEVQADPAPVLGQKKPKKMSAKARRHAFVDAVKAKEQQEEEEAKKKKIVTASEKKQPLIIADGVSFIQEPGRVSTRAVTTTLNDFKAAKQVLKKMEINFFTYTATPQSTVTRVLQRIPPDYTAAEVQEELKRAPGLTVDLGEMNEWTREEEREREDYLCLGSRPPLNRWRNCRKPTCSTQKPST